MSPDDLPENFLRIAITGHRGHNPSLAANRAGIMAALDEVFDACDAASARGATPGTAPRLYSLLAHGVDSIAVDKALARNWNVQAPMPFGLNLNVAINAEPTTAADAQALIEGRAPHGAAVAERARELRALALRVRRFELAEQDTAVAALLTARLQDAANPQLANNLGVIVSQRVAAANRVMIDHCDLMIAVWDGTSPAAVGGTHHSIAAALERGTAVLWIDAREPQRRFLLTTIEDLAAPGSSALPLRPQRLAALLDNLLNEAAADFQTRAGQYHAERWRPASHRWFHSYRRIESMFGRDRHQAMFRSLKQRYETPQEIASGSGAALLQAAQQLAGADASMTACIARQVLPRFARADGVATFLADAYRSGMVTNFQLSALAIIGGVAYLPFTSAHGKWPFALFEFCLLCMILVIIAVGRRNRWHGRWFETRRLAEYLRHAPLLMLMGIVRAHGRWPGGSGTRWPELYARRVWLAPGLPGAVVGQQYLRTALEELLLLHVRRQKDYHLAKSLRLARAHHRLDRLSESLFFLAVVTVGSYLLLAAAAAAGLAPQRAVDASSKFFTLLGVAFPTLGGALAGIRYFGDFERFAAISQAASGRLATLESRIRTLLAGAADGLQYSQVAVLAHEAEDIVIAEIEGWQAVFGGKKIAAPV